MTMGASSIPVPLPACGLSVFPPGTAQHGRIRIREKNDSMMIRFIMSLPLAGVCYWFNR